MAAGMVVKGVDVLLQDEGELPELSEALPRKWGIPPAPVQLQCVTSSRDLLVIGTNHSMMIVYHFRTLNTEKVSLEGSLKRCGVSSLAMAPEVFNRTAIGRQNGLINIYQLADSEEHKRRSMIKKLHTSSVTCVAWDTRGALLFSGDESGQVFATEVNMRDGKHHSWLVHSCSSAIVQLSYASMMLLVSSTASSVLCNIARDITQSNPVKIGSKDRKVGAYGGCFSTAGGGEEHGIVVYVTRPGLRVWRADCQGKVLATLKFKDLFEKGSVPAIKVGGRKRDAAGATSGSEVQQLSRLAVACGQFLLAWQGDSLCLLDPVSGQIVGHAAGVGQVLDLSIYRKWVVVLREPPYARQSPVVRLSFDPSLVPTGGSPAITPRFRNAVDSPTTLRSLESLLGTLVKSKSAGSDSAGGAASDSALAAAAAADGATSVTASVAASSSAAASTVVAAAAAPTEQVASDSVDGGTAGGTPVDSKPTEVQATPAVALTEASESAGRATSGDAAEVLAEEKAATESKANQSAPTAAVVPTAVEIADAPSSASITGDTITPGSPRCPSPVLATHSTSPPVAILTTSAPASDPTSNDPSPDVHDAAAAGGGAASASATAVAQRQPQVGPADEKTEVVRVQQPVAQSAPKISQPPSKRYAADSKVPIIPPQFDINMDEADTTLVVRPKAKRKGKKAKKADGDAGTATAGLDDRADVSSPTPVAYEEGDRLPQEQARSPVSRQSSSHSTQQADAAESVSQSVPDSSVPESQATATNVGAQPVGAQPVGDACVGAGDIVHGPAASDRLERTAAVDLDEQCLSEAATSADGNDSVQAEANLTIGSPGDAAVVLSTAGNDVATDESKAGLLSTVEVTVGVSGSMSTHISAASIFGDIVEAPLSDRFLGKSSSSTAISTADQGGDASAAAALDADKGFAELSGSSSGANSATNSGEHIPSIYDMDPAEPEDEEEVEGVIDAMTESDGAAVAAAAAAATRPAAPHREVFVPGGKRLGDSSSRKAAEKSKASAYDVALTDSWMPCPAPCRQPIQSLTCTPTHIWVVDSKDTVHTWSLGKRRWHTLKGSLRQIAASPSGDIVWACSKSGSLYHRVGIERRMRIGTDWHKMDMKVKSIAVDNKRSWVLTSTGQIKLRRDVSLAVPTGQQWLAVEDVPSNIRFLVAGNGVLWAVTTLNVVLARVAISHHKPVGTGWEMVCPGHEFLDVAIGVNGTAWFVSTDGVACFMKNVSLTTPLGDGQLWLSALGQFVVHDASLLEALWTWSLVKQIDPIRCVSASSNCVVVLSSNSSILYSGGSMVGSWYKSVSLAGVAPSITWISVSASNVHGSGGNVWLLQRTGEVFCIKEGGRPVVVEVTGRYQLVQISTSLASVWAVSSEGQVLERQGVSDYCPTGTSWQTLSTVPQKGTKIRHVSCGLHSSWAVDDRGQAWLRLSEMGQKALGAASPWLAVDGSTSSTKFTQVVVGPGGWHVWAVDTAGCSYARLDVGIDTPSGTSWQAVGGVNASKLCISNTRVWVCCANGDLVWRSSVTPCNPAGDYWKRLPGTFSEASVTPDDTLWLIGPQGFLFRRETCVYDGSAKMSKPVAGASLDTWVVV